MTKKPRPKESSNAASRSPADKETRAEAERVLSSAERAMRRRGPTLTAEEQARIRTALDALRAELDNDAQKGAANLDALVSAADEAATRAFGKYKKSAARETWESLVVMGAIALLFRAFVFEPFRIPSGSMIPTLEVGDHILVNKFLYGLRVPFTNLWLTQWSEPERGDVIVFRFPEDTSKDYIKRVVALPGDRVRVEDTDVYVNGEKLERGSSHRYVYQEDVEPGVERAFLGEATTLAYPETPSAVPSKTYTVLYRDDVLGRPAFPQAHTHVPGLDCTSNGEGASVQHDAPRDCLVLDGYLFAMGDNRDNSSDGRVWGGVPRSYLAGKAMFVWWSRGEIAGIRWRRFFSWIH